MLPKFEISTKKEAKENKTRIIFSLFAVIILFTSVVGFALLYAQEGNSGSKYGKYNFIQTEEGWQTSIDGYFIQTDYLPQYVEEISYTGDILNKDNFQSIVYFVSESEVERKAADKLDKMIVAQKKDVACLPEDFEKESCKDMNIRSCENASYIQKIIVLNEIEGNETSIIHENNCITIKGNKYNLIKACDKVIFMLFEIIKQE